MAHVRRFCVFILCSAMAGAPAWSGTPALGMVTLASKAYLGTTTLSSGTTIFDGDRLSTERDGIIQMRTKTAQLRLSQAGAAEVSGTQEALGAKLLRGVAAFSAANSKALLLHASIADIRPETDAPTVGQVVMVSPKELRVQCTRGAIAVTVDGETKIVSEATAYRVLLDTDASAPEPAQEPEGAGTRKPNRSPRRAGRSRAVYLVIAATAIGGSFAVHEALESPDRP